MTDKLETIDSVHCFVNVCQYVCETCVCFIKTKHWCEYYVGDG